mmetsp:Transcript_31457/g.88252  ORF Transcript_31457/g.88252 Transcript_31457/m.88252 type:complete len:170 (+) Transcript_31457:111-620(+)|eukprot:CAMPEP_0119135802 /NCGR_PEP_ID=MMETSP1310-20130426/20091_1 /TAXON_ID=464262 /ORGANISM="Genus nov. species nov., Strain RCC2339" /LENGTH=169 /DNA_ID=CAMNT_0007126739 /DNA_START=93 /DNA_END=602 /DNA_ORIENTATION=+
MENPHELSQILSWLYLGSRHARAEEAILKEAGVGLVCDCSKLEGLPVYDGISYQFYDILDCEEADIRPVLDEACEAIRGWRDADSLAESRTSVFVHCNQGVSRSASVILSYLIKHEDMTLKEAFLHVKKQRRVIMPNPGFFGKLIEWEDTHRGVTTAELGKYGQIIWKK